MNTIAIVYFSAKGSTERLAKPLLRGILHIGEHPKLLKVIGSDIINGRYVNEDILKSIDEADAILWGSPTFMGGAAAGGLSLWLMLPVAAGLSKGGKTKSPQASQ